MPSLSNRENLIIIDCLNTIIHNSLIDEKEFQTRLGLSRKEIKLIIINLKNKKKFCDYSEKEKIAINNCLNEICNGIQILPEDWKKWIKFPREEVNQVYAKWLSVTGFPGGIN